MDIYMFDFLSAMIFVLATWIGLGLIIIGIGLVVYRVFGIRIMEGEDLFYSFWLGFTFIIIMLQIWHFYWRIDWRVLALVTGFGLVGLLLNMKAFCQSLQKDFSGKFWLWLSLILVAVFTAAHTILLPLTCDSGLYHLSAVRWAATYPIVPGLGNLHSRLGNNSSFFLYVAMLEVGPWAHLSHHFANGLLILMLLMQIILSGFKFWQNEDQRQVQHLFTFLFLAPVLNKVNSPYASSPSPDLIIFSLGIVISIKLFSLLCKSTGNLKEDGFAVFIITCLSAVGITVKLSFSGFGIVAPLLAIIVWLARRSGLDRVIRYKVVAWVTICAALVLIPWMARNVILNGYLAYPTIIGEFNVDWRVPRERVIAESNAIYRWSRVYDSKETYGKWNWLYPWLYRNLTKPSLLYDGPIPFALCLLSLAGICFYRGNGGDRANRSMKPYLIFLPTIAQIIFWFVTAPDLGYTGASFWILGSGSVALAMTRSSLFNSKRRLYFSVFSLTIVLSIVPLAKTFLQNLALIGPGGYYGFRPVPRPALRTFTTRSGLVIYIHPENGNRCFDGPLPCTVYPNPDLSLRESGKLSSGFRVKDKCEP